MNFESHLIYGARFPKRPPVFFENAVLIYDRKLSQVAPAFIRQFSAQIAVKAGEDLKSWSHTEKILSRLLKLSKDMQKSELRIVLLGGGSVGDFGGFCASVLRRGTPLIQIPSTWLAAVDSAHGGKTALNLGGAKNQIGTYWPAAEVWLVRELLEAQPARLEIDARGEVYKSAIIAGGPLFKKIRKSPRAWTVLKDVIDTKMKVVLKDPHEKKGLRQSLNLGHTIGHVLESELRLPHGRAVLLGLAFAVEWRRHELRMKGHFQTSAWMTEVMSWAGWPSPVEVRQTLNRVRNWEQKIKTDKKSLGNGRMQFVFPLAPGKVEVQVRLHADLLAEIDRQKK